MAYSTFTLSQMSQQFHLQINEKNELFRSVPEVALRPEFQALLNELAPLALAVASEKARSELIIAPVLLEVWRMTGQQIGFFSGVNFDVDKSQGLDGFCDYILTRSPRQLFVEASVLMVVEAKNEDMKKDYAQCMAEMIAAQRFNEREGTAMERLYGVVTIGELWRFMELEGATVRLDSRSYHIDRLPKIMGILLHLTGMHS